MRYVQHTSRNVSHCLLMTDLMLTVVLLATCAAIASGKSAVDHHHSQRWVTKVLYDALEKYTPDGGPMCRRDGQAYRKGLKDLQLWATRMYDASAKFPTGILNGKVYDFGDYDECLETDTTGLNFKTQYCIVNIIFSPSFKLYPNYYNTSLSKLSPSVSAWEATKSHRDPTKVQRNEINTAICIPSSCTHSDLQSTLSPKIASSFHELQIDATVNVNSVYCTTQHADQPKTLGYIIFWFFFIVICMLIIVGSTYDLYSKEDSKLKYKQFFIAFSIRSNTKQLLYSGTKNAKYSGINFIKVVTCSIVFFGHRLMHFAAFPLHNINKIEESFDYPFPGILQSGPTIVDAFFAISGFITFLNVYSLIQKNQQFNMPLLILYRWCRLIPVYGVMIAFSAFVFFRLSDGPLWKYVAVRESENCLKNWWTNVLFINNYVDTENPCVIHSWYLACDLHMFILGILMVYFVWKYPKWEKLALLTAIFVSCFVSAYVVYKHKYYPTFFGFISTVKYPPSQEAFRMTYVPTHMRLTPYFVGMYAARVYRDTKANQPNFQFSHVTLRLSALLCGYLLWMIPIAYFYQNEYNVWASALYTFVHRLVFAVLISAFIVVLAVNTCFNEFSARILASLSRLTYAAYLGGIPLQLFQSASMRTPTYFSILQASWLIIGDIVHGFIVAFILYMMIESPFENLLNQLFNKVTEGKAKEKIPNKVQIVPQNMEKNRKQ